MAFPASDDNSVNSDNSDAALLALVSGWRRKRLNEVSRGVLSAVSELTGGHSITVGDRFIAENATAEFVGLSPSRAHAYFQVTFEESGRTREAFLDLAPPLSLRGQATLCLRVNEDDSRHYGRDPSVIKLTEYLGQEEEDSEEEEEEEAPATSSPMEVMQWLALEWGRFPTRIYVDGKGIMYVEYVQPE